MVPVTKSVKSNPTQSRCRAFGSAHGWDGERFSSARIIVCLLDVWEKGGRLLGEKVPPRSALSLIEHKNKNHSPLVFYFLLFPDKVHRY